MRRIFTILLIIVCFRCLGEVPRFIIESDYSGVDSLKKVALGNGSLQERILAHNLLGAYYEGISNYKNALHHLYSSDRLNNGTDKEQKAFCYNYLGYVYWHKSEYKIAVFYHNKALAISIDTTVSRSALAFTYLMLGGDYYDLGDYEKTSEYYFRALQVSEEIKDEVGQIMAHNRLSKLYFKLKDFQRSKEQARIAQSINSTLHYERETAVSFNCLGNVYIESGSVDSALFYFKQTLFHFKKCGDVIGQAVASINLGDTYSRLYSERKNENDLDQAYDYYKMSYMLNSRVDNKFGMIYGLWGVSDIDLRRGKTEPAMQNYRKALSLAKAINAKVEQYDLHWKMYKVFEQQGRTDSSHFYLKNYVELKNSMENEEQTKALLRQESKYEIAKRIDEKNAELKRDRLIEEEKNKRKNYLIIAVVIIMLVLAYAVIMSLKRLRTIQSQNELINSINSKLTMQKTEIMDSITYARRIQEAILPSEKFLRESLPQSFVLYLPKDIVAGDFYWMEKTGDEILIAVADCTGHGVPGALVSVVCSNALNRAVLEFGITEPGRLLDKTRELVLDAFSRSDKNVNDGMDISLLSINVSTRIVKWAGANNPLWYVSDDVLKEITAHKQPIGKTENPSAFVTHTLHMKKGDLLYLFTDGYADQFGGQKGKKFKYKPLKAMLQKNAGLEMSEQKRLLESAFNEWRSNLEQVDDVTVIGIRIS